MLEGCGGSCGCLGRVCLLQAAVSPGPCDFSLPTQSLFSGTSCSSSSTTSHHYTLQHHTQALSLSPSPSLHLSVPPRLQPRTACPSCSWLWAMSSLTAQGLQRSTGRSSRPNRSLSPPLGQEISSLAAFASEMVAWLWFATTSNSAAGCPPSKQQVSPQDRFLRFIQDLLTTSRFDLSSDLSRLMLADRPRDLGSPSFALCGDPRAAVHLAPQEQELD